MGMKEVRVKPGEYMPKRRGPDNFFKAIALGIAGVLIAILVITCLWLEPEISFHAKNGHRADSETQYATDMASKVINTSAENSVSSNKEVSSNQNAISFEKMTVVDNDQCTIEIIELDPDNIWGYTLKVTLENKSPDKTYMFSVTNAAINGVQSDPGFAAEVAPGKKANKEINFSNATLKENGISDFSDIELRFRVYDSNDWTANAVAEETTHVYPYGEDKSTVFVREPQNSDNIILDNDYVTVTVTGYTEDTIWGYTVNLFLVNKTDKETMFSVEDASVNGYMIDPFYASSVMPNKCAFSSMSWGNSALEENGIESIDEIEFTIKAYDSNDWTAEPYAREVITLTPSNSN